MLERLKNYSAFKQKSLILLCLSADISKNHIAFPFILTLGSLYFIIYLRDCTR